MFVNKKVNRLCISTKFFFLENLSNYFKFHKLTLFKIETKNYYLEDIEIVSSVISYQIDMFLFSNVFQTNYFHVHFLILTEKKSNNKK